MAIKTILIFILITVNPAGNIAQDVTVVEKCPPKNLVVPALKEKVMDGRILGYWASCTPFNMRDPVGNPT